MGTSVLHIKTEVECRVYLFDEEKGIAKPGTYFNLEVRKGEQDLLFVSTENEGVICLKSYNVEEDDCNYRMTLEQSQFINVSTPATEEEISSGVEDEFGVIYSHDGLQLLSVWNDMFIEYHIQDGCKVIRGCAFSECINLTAITLPAGLTHIGNRAFSSCNLTTITLPASLTYIGDCAFSGTGIRNVVSLSPNFTFRDGCLIDQINHRLLAYLSDKDKVSLPVGLTHIGYEAFYGCDYLIAITLPNSLTYIGKSAFSRCSNLTTVSLPNSMTHIEDSAFWGCQNLTAITLPSGLIHIGDRAFEGCEKLTAITLPDGLTHIGNRAFMWCNNLTTITLPNSLTHIGNSAFSGCGNLTAITLPAGLTHIGDDAFWWCAKLTAIHIPKGMKEHFKALLPSDLHSKLKELEALPKSPEGTLPENTNIFSKLKLYAVKPKLPEGALSGLFTINANGDKVRFSQGNLQYQASTNIWRFAEHQWDYMGAANSKIGATNNGWIDLFGWGTGNNPTLASKDNRDYCIYVDWGVNPISNGGNTPNLWRILTVSEWKYLLYTRASASVKWALGNINGARGLILLPDNWTLPSVCSFNAGFSSTWGDWWHNTYTLSQWAMMEAAGAVFLPAAGSRWGTRVEYVGDNVHYWSSNQWDSFGYYMYFFSGYYTDMYYNCGFRSSGLSVRLVRLKY